jgi:argininosuccinate lyase
MPIILPKRTRISTATNEEALDILLAIKEAGADFGGNLQLARSRNDLGQALFRMAFRQQILGLAGCLLDLRQAVFYLASDHVETIMPGYTHTQPAQATTFAHYLAGVLSFLEMDQQWTKSSSPLRFADRAPPKR